MAREADSIPVRAGLLTVYAVISGPRTWRSLKVAIDTGVTHTMVPPELLVDIGCHPAKATRHLELSTENGVIMAPMVRVRALKCLGLTIRNLEVVTNRLPPESPVEGLLGLDVLSHFKPFQAFSRAIRLLSR